MEKSEMYIISGNYFTARYISMITTELQKSESSCYINYDGNPVSLKSTAELSQLCEIVPGKKVKISCYHSDYRTAYNDLEKVRKLIEHDFTAAIESD